MVKIFTRAFRKLLGNEEIQDKIMTYGKRYAASFKDKQNATWTVNIFKKNYSFGVSQINYLDGEEPVILNRRGDKDDRDGIIWGSELIVNIVVNKNDDFSELIDSNYRDFKIELRKGALLRFVGFLKPENITRPWLGEIQLLSLSCTDALADLKEIDFVYDSEMTIMQVVANALKETGIELPFIVRSNTIEADNTTLNPAIYYATVRTKRLLKEESKKIKYSSCYKAIEAVLLPFNCVLFQEDGNYHIYNFSEINSNRKFIPFDLSSNSDFAGSDITTLALDSYQFLDDGISQRIPPIKGIELTFTNENRGENKIVNGDFSDDLTNWECIGTADTGFFHNFQNIGGALQIQRNASIAPMVELYEDCYINHLPLLSLQKTEDGDKVKVTFETASLRIDFHSFKITIRPFLTDTSGLSHYTGIEHTLSPGTTIITDEIDYLEGDYYLGFQITTKKTAQLINENQMFRFKIDSVTLDIKLQNEEFERVLTLSNPNAGGKVYEQEILFADSEEATDLGAIKINDALSSSWKREGKTEEITLMAAYADTILSNNIRYRDFIKVNIFDPYFTLLNAKTPTIGIKNFLMIAFSKNIKRCEVEADLIEIISYQNVINPPSNLVITSFGFNFINLQWEASPLPGVTYDLTINFTTYYLDDSTIYNFAASPNTAYTIYVRAKDAGGTRSEPTNIVEVTTPAIFPAPTNLTYEIVDDIINFYWDMLDGTTGVDRYEIWRDDILITTHSGPQPFSMFSETGAFDFKIRARGTAGETSYYSNTVTVSIAAYFPPPTGLYIIIDGQTVEFYWDIESLTDVEVFEMFVDGVFYTTADVVQPALFDYSFALGKTFKIRARKTGGEVSEFSNEFTV